MNKYKKGFTVLELLIVLGIIGLLVRIIIPGLASFRNNQILKNNTQDIVSLLNQARSDTLSSLNSTNYGVHIETSRVVYFVGSNFTEPNSSNVVYTLDSNLQIPSSGGINLNGGGANVVFDRLTGDTNNYGTIVIRLSSDATKQRTITINKTGILSSN